MAFRNLFISSKAYVRSSQNRIKLENEDNTLEIPFEDLGAVVIDAQQATITTSALKSLALNNASLFICDDKHQPIGVFTSFQNHSHQAKQLKKQLALSNSFNGKLWKKLVMQKLVNQAFVLNHFGFTDKSGLLELISGKVTMHDKTNREAYAAAIYFRTLFGNNFTRRNEEKVNSALNYGFAIIRGVIARHISAFGLLPSVGVHHKNEYNNFNLADDLIEPYRPFVEFFTQMFINGDDSELSKGDRAALLDVLNMQVQFKSKQYSLETSIEQMVKSLITAINKNDPDKLVLPEFGHLQRKKYE